MTKQMADLRMVGISSILSSPCLWVNKVRAIPMLSDREEQVLKLRSFYKKSISDCYPLILTEETDYLGNGTWGYRPVSKERIRQLESKAYRKLLHPINYRKLIDIHLYSDPNIQNIINGIL